MIPWIDMRRELSGLINGDRVGIAQGFWVVVRIMRIGQYSRYWNEDRKEAIGGPKWNYDDYLVRCIASANASLGMLNRLEQAAKVMINAGIDDVNNRIFAIEWNPKMRRPIPMEDILYEIAECEGPRPPRPPLTVIARYRIVNVVLVHGDFGRTEVINLICKRMHGES